MSQQWIRCPHSVLEQLYRLPQAIPGPSFTGNLKLPTIVPLKRNDQVQLVPTQVALIVKMLVELSALKLPPVLLFLPPQQISLPACFLSSQQTVGDKLVKVQWNIQVTTGPIPLVYAHLCMYRFKSASENHVTPYRDCICYGESNRLVSTFKGLLTHASFAQRWHRVNKKCDTH